MNTTCHGHQFRQVHTRVTGVAMAAAAMTWRTSIGLQEAALPFLQGMMGRGVGGGISRRVAPPTALHLDTSL